MQTMFWSVRVVAGNWTWSSELQEAAYLNETKQKSYPKVDQFLSKSQGNKSICTWAKSIERMNEQQSNGAEESSKEAGRKGKQSLSAWDLRAVEAEASRMGAVEEDWRRRGRTGYAFSLWKSAINSSTLGFVCDSCDCVKQLKLILGGNKMEKSFMLIISLLLYFISILW